MTSLANHVEGSCASTEFWHRPQVAFGQLPTLKALIAACDEGVLAETVVAECAGFHSWREGGSRKRRRAMEERVRSALAEMALVSAADVGAVRVVFAREAFVLEQPSLRIARRIEAVLESGRLQGPERLSDLSWESALGCRVWLDAGLCCRERYLALADAFWQMTYYGFSEAERDWRFAHTVANEPAQVDCDGAVVAFDGGAEGFGGKALCGESDAESASEDEYGLRVVDPFAQDYQRHLAETVGLLNECAAERYLESQEDLLRRVKAYENANALGRAA